jgi:DNA-binding transcriptional ArsR family regulator
MWLSAKELTNELIGENIPTFLRMLEYPRRESREVFLCALMQTTKSVIRRPGARTKRLERIVKGFANHRRIEILELLERHPEMCVNEISEKLQIEMKTASEHLRRLAIAGLLLKRYEGREVRHAITEQARNILSFLDKLA